MTTKRILVADDDVNLLEALSTRLESEGFEVTTSRDAYQALAFARRDRPDLLLLDINMPAGNGFSVQDRIAEIDELADVPVVYITGADPDRVDAEARAHGGFAVVHKPFDTGALLDTIRAALGYWVENPAESRDA